jgi:hypothetical protein
MPTRNYNDWLVIRRDHQLQTDPTNVGLNLIFHLFGYFLVILAGRILYFLNQVNCIVLHALFDLHLVLYLLSCKSFAPHLPFLFMFFQIFLSHFLDIIFQKNVINLRFFKKNNQKVLTKKYGK